ncbi:MAG: hypothetical protein R3D66_01280 [Alphaproteobacteria bacterium]
MMSGLQTLRIHPKKVLERLEEFEMFCLGEASLTPEHLKILTASSALTLFSISESTILKMNMTAST